MSRKRTLLSIISFAFIAFFVFALRAGMESRETLAALIKENKVRTNVIGTGETIGHVADVRIDNLTDQSISFSIPSVVLESASGKNQDYVVPHDENVALRPHESKTVPMDGICVNRHKPPVGKGIGGELIINDPTGSVPPDSHSHLKRNDADKLLRITKSKYDTADKLEKDGALKDIPYKDKKKRKEVVEQWSVWSDPQISEIEGGPPATKDDLKKVVDKQVEKVPPDEKKKIDKGIDTIWDKIELTNEKAKDLEKPEDETVEETPPVGQPEYVGQGHTYAKQPTPTATPKPKGGGKTTTKPTPTPTPTPTPKEEPKTPGTEEKPKDGGQPGTDNGGGKVPPAANKPKEAVVVVQIKGDPTNNDMLRSANALKNHLDNAGQDAQRVVMGNIPGADIQSIDELERYLKNKVMKGACLHSFHLLGHGRKNESSGNYVFEFPPRFGHEEEEDEVWVDEPDPRPARGDEKPPHSQFGRDNFAKIFKNVMCPDGEVFLEECYSSAKSPASDSLSQTVADQTGLKVHGHDKTVLFPLDMPPRPGETDSAPTSTPKPK